jgi:hypothetical protein
MRHFCAFRQESQPLHEPKLLPPFPKCHSDFLLEQPFDRPLSRPGPFAQLGEGSTIARIAHQYFCDSNQSWIGQMRELQRDRLHRFQLMKNYGGQMRLPFHGLLKGTHGTGVKNQFLEKR